MGIQYLVGEEEGEPAKEMGKEQQGGRRRNTSVVSWKPRKASTSRSMAGSAMLNAAEGMQVS